MKPAANQAFTKIRNFIQRFPLIAFACVLGLAMVGASLLFASKVEKAAPPSFDSSRVLPQPVTPQAASSTVFTAETIKQYDGKEGRKCYVAVKGTVYEISGKGQWQGGQHQPSNNQAYCGADLTEAIKKSPHGESKLTELPKVGVFKSE